MSTVAVFSGGRPSRGDYFATTRTNHQFLTTKPAKTVKSAEAIATRYTLYLLE
jgi:hypothetical protein